MNKHCVACGDDISSKLPDYLCETYNNLTSDERRNLNKARKTLCDECALETAAGIVPRPSTLTHGTGGGNRVVKSGKEMS
jgi:hypothetical protein